MTRIRFFWIRLTRFEFWNSYIFYAPFFWQWLYYSARSRNFLYFSCVNEGVPFGGLLQYSKNAMMRDIDPCYQVETVMFTSQQEFQSEQFQDFPYIFKPDIGERGKGVRIVHSRTELEKAVQEENQSFLLQKYCDYPIELGVFYFRYPSGESTISSIVQKGFLTVRGDGNLTLRALINNELRARKRLSYFEAKFQHRMDEVVPDGTSILLEEIGNHCRGTTFYDASELISDDLVKVFDQITANMPWFHYGRFDLKVKSIEDLKQGKNLQIFELNGINSEVAHIYDPSYSLFKAYRDVSKHLHVMYKISKELHHKESTSKPSLHDFALALKERRSNTRKLTQ